MTSSSFADAHAWFTPTPALALFGLYVYNSNSARITAWYMGIVVLTVIFDITWCGIWGTVACYGRGRWGRGMSFESSL